MTLWCHHDFMTIVPFDNTVNLAHAAPQHSIPCTHVGLSTSSLGTGGESEEVMVI